LASTTICMHNLREIGHSLTLYTVENDGWLPTNRVVPTSTPQPRYRRSGPSKLPADQVWFLKLYPTYLNDPVALTCPEDPFRFRMMKVGSELNDSSISDYASYGINSFLMTAADGRLAHIDRFHPTRPADTILVADLGPDHAFNRKVSGKGVLKEPGKVEGPRRNGAQLSWNDGFDPLAVDDRIDPWLTKRHGEGINILTLTGGVRPARTAELVRRPMQRYYDDCFASGCSLCGAGLLEQLFHYSFARDRLFWWTGPVVTD